MSMKTEILENFESISSEKEMRAYLNEIITALHDINCSSLAFLIKEGALSEDRANSKQEQTDVLLKQIVENILENIRMCNMTKKVKAYEALKKENEALASKVEKAKIIIAEKDAEIEKTKKATRNDIKKKLQIGRDRIVAIANTSTALGECVDDTLAIDIVNNIRDNVRLLTEEMISLGLWGEDEEKPNVEPLIAKGNPVGQKTYSDEELTVTETIDEIVEEKPKKKIPKKPKKKISIELEADKALDTIDNIDSFEDDGADKKNMVDA